MNSPDSNRKPCPHIPFCELFPKFQQGTTLKFWKSMYCEGRFHRCARYQLSLEGKSAPADLLPDGQRLIKLGSNPPAKD